MRRANLTKEFIMEDICVALVRLMKQKEYLSITVSDICREAGYGRTTYYRYFSNDKDELILYLTALRFKQNYKDRFPDELREDEAMLMLKSVYEHRDFYLLLAKHKLNHLLFKVFFQEYRRKDDEDELLKYVKSFSAGAYFGVVYQWILDGCTDTPSEIADKFRRGLMLAASQVQKPSAPV